ncbi:heme-degrading domain-containing protein [Martelella mediterranea]|uniref:Uncharacterized protein (UPF0303 family) n=1 Tax=Martelella mediterranea TaxID=293089 RepID=A0A4R3NHQ6_9HYPH|nr:heme-degrading domain-containing protein [Martelella mediterranea]TCT32997.1 uncharacterized protein (UPF0303 family) [Martelella mediterranea]
MSELQDRITRLEAERGQLVLPSFNEDVAFAIGTHIRQHASVAKHPIAIEVSGIGGRLFFAAMPGASPDNAEWIRRKRNVVERFLESSLLVTLRCDERGRKIPEQFKLSDADFVHSGGGVAIRTADSGFVGCVTVSGLTQYQDHELGVEALRALVSAKA